MLRGFIAAVAAGADEFDEYGQDVAMPVAIATPESALAELYRRVPGPLPHLFEQLLLSYRWPRADIDLIEVFANPPGGGLQPFAQQPFEDPGLADALIPARYVQFAKAGGGNYDPVCFDLRGSAQDDCPIVQIDHEEILCNFRIQPVATLAPSFRALLEMIVKNAKPAIGQ